MKRRLLCAGVILAAATLSGCYYDPGYTYVRGAGVSGDAYYGSGSTYYASPYDSYYGPAYYNGYYGGYYGCCYGPRTTIGISTRWYGGSHYRSHRGDGHRYRGDDHRDRGGDHRHDRHDGDRGHHDSRRGGRPSHDRGDRRH